MANNPTISVIIPTLDRGLSMHDLLSSIERQLFPSSRRDGLEVIVVSNLPNPKLKRVVESYGNGFHYYETGRLGANLARNKGIEKATGEIIVFLDDDCYVADRFFLDRILHLHRQYPRAAGIGGRYLLKDGATLTETAYHWIADHWLSTSKTDSLRTLNLVGGNCSFKSRLLGSLLRFNDEIVFGGTETELCARLVRSGHELILIDDLTVVHRLNVSSTQFRRKAFLQGQSAGRRARADLIPEHRYWGSKISVLDYMYLLKEPATPALKRKFRAYEKYFSSGYNSLRPFSWSRYLERRISEAVQKTYLAFYRFHLLIEGALKVSERP